LLAPILLERGSGNVWVRDFQARDSLLFAQYPQRPVYVFFRKGADADAPFEWIAIDRDSALKSWRNSAP
jgi:hypothetical protein